MSSDEDSMEQSHSSQKRKRNSLQNQAVKQTLKMKKTDSKSEKVLSDTYCQTVTVQLKMEESGTEDLTISKYSQTDTGPYCGQPTPLCPKPPNTTLVCSTELGDPPLLRQPQHTTLTGIQQIIECFRSGTVQAKLTLLKEVDTIFECQLCRSLFRGLPNLLEHRQSYCLSRQPEPDDPSQVMKDLLETVFSQRDSQESPLRIVPKPVYQDHTLTPAPNSHQQNSVSRKLCRREPVVVLRRFQQPHTASFKVAPVSQERGGIKEIEREDDCEEGYLPHLQDTMTSRELEELKSDLEWDTVSQSGVKKQHSSSHKTVHVKLGEKATMHQAPTLKKTCSCRMCNRRFVSQRSLMRHISVDHNIRTLRKDTAKNAKSELVPGSMVGDGEACEEEHLSAGKRCHVCQKSSDKEPKVHCHCNELPCGLKQDCTTPASVKQSGQSLSTQAAPVPQKQPNSKPVTEGISPQEAAHFSKDRVIPWMKDLFYCGLCKQKYSSQGLLLKHMSISHKFHVLENTVASRTPPPRKVKAKVKPEEKAFHNVRIYCWLCGKKFYSRTNLRSHCHKDHRQKLQEFNMLLKQGIGNSLVHEMHSLENGFAASHTPPTPLLPAR
ncbi:zinc finger protein 800-like [Salminus brasiliensis]|uniref:zinc finger protein 800-like n=1 Tax=Salminus brasiliensis TaxID=930266 RepID=UPI003B831F44